MREEKVENVEIRAKKAALLLAFPIALLILISPFTSELGAYLRQMYAVSEPQPLVIELSKTDLDLKVLENMIAQGLYVPNYDVEVLTRFDDTAFVVGDPVRFTLSVKDKGILKLLKPYFYLFIVDPGGKVRAVFPEVWSGNLAYWNKWPQWYVGDHPQAFYKDAMMIRTGDKEYYVPRSTLINGSGRYVYAASGYLYWTEKPASVKMQFAPKETEGLKAGVWSVYTFVFDDIYVDRKGNKIESVNAVGYAIHTFQIVGKSIQPQKAPDLLPFLSRLIPSLFGALGTFGLLYKTICNKYATLNRLYEKIKREKFLLVGIILIILAFLSVLLLGLATLMRTPATT